MNTYEDDAVDKWPTFVPPPAPTGLATAATISMWEMDKPLEGSFDDLEIGRDGKVYAVNISKHRVIAQDPISGTQTAIAFAQRSCTPLHRNSQRWQPVDDDVRERPDGSL